MEEKKYSKHLNKQLKKQSKRNILLERKEKDYKSLKTMRL